uniref:Uncharacterized protein n=1 Tax=Panagrolaimus sp. PS1159 TaxID=55785 RepID=A0AC35GMJ2_9BILA
MYLLRFLTVFAVVQIIYAGTGQGIEPNNGKISSKEVEESVKQEVFLKTANAEPIEIDRVKRFESNDNAPVQSLRRTPELDEGTPAPRLGYGTDKNLGIGHGTRGSVGIGSGTVYNGYQPNVGIGSGTSVSGSSPGIGSGTGYGSYTPKQNVGIGGGTVGSGTYNSYTPDIGHGIKVDGKVPAIGSGTADDIDHVAVTTQRTPMIGGGVDVNGNEDFSIGKGTEIGDSKGAKVHLNSDPDSVNTELGGEVGIGRGVNRGPNIVTPSEYTCWRVSNQRKNCTEIDNIVYLKNQGFEPEEYELPRRGSSNIDRTQQHPRPRGRQQSSEEYETSHNSRQHPRPRPIEQDGIVIQGENRPYDPYNPTPSAAPGATHRYVTSTLKLGRDNSLELDDNRELYRQKRKRAVKTKKPYYIPPDYEIIDEYEEMRARHKPQKPKQEQQQELKKPKE